jgi:tRNA(Ile)-lysidine synthase
MYANEGREECRLQMCKTEQKVLKYVEKHHMIQPQDKLVAGISGGADSVCLFYMLKEMKARFGVHFIAVHVNHNLRGAEAARDEKFVRNLCERENVPYYAVHANVKETAAREGMTLEEAGRKVRYQAFEQILQKEGADKIVLAHHQDDLAETMIHHLARGTGISGLCSLKPVSGNRIRPLLCLERREIEIYLTKRGSEWKEDSTNGDDHFTRNKIRHNVIHYLSREINPGTAAHMAQTAEELDEIQELIQGIADEKREKLTSIQEGAVLILEEMRKEQKYLQRRIFLDVLADTAGSRKDFTRAHAEAVEGLWEKPTGKKISLPYRICAVRTYEGICIEKKTDEGKGQTAPAVSECCELIIPGETKVGEINIKCEIIPHNFTGIEEKKYTKWLDYDKMKRSLELRHRKSGDRISVHPSGGSKKLKDYLIDRKIPQKARDELYLLADGRDILWVIGDRISERYKVTDTTRQVLYIEIRGGNIHE